MIGTDRIKAAVEAVMRRLATRYEYAGLWGYTVVSQNDDFTLEIKPDRPDQVPMLSGVPSTCGNPTMNVRVPPGVRCYVKFVDMDPGQPFVRAWNPGDVNVLTVCDGTAPMARMGDMIEAAAPTGMSSALVNGALPAQVHLISPLTLYGTIMSGTKTVEVGG